MADYGHPLRFGTFITPLNNDPEGVVGLAQTTEAAGLDLVTFQDHPYQPRFFDSWTLLSYVAARTERVSLAPNVINLPLRPPAVLARSAASLDILSGGRIELALGAGAFWEAIEAMGGRRLKPGDAVAALEEAIDIIRELWTPESGGVRLDGQHYRVVGAKRGPAPAHPMPIWVGAQKPRMQRLIGRKADGWLVTLGNLQRGGVVEGNKVIDDAAVEVGRNPADVQRWLNVPSGMGHEALAELALLEGISTFVIASDDAREIRRFGEDIAPATREVVARDRAAR
jgi:alkanesulfonate monooxygenase SsuD/methylene tetrahydromethanopterin reductase-like flavin-dependent oxidoreductase (luciferase family)